MRLTPVAIRYHSNVEEAMKIAALQSLTTHGGQVSLYF
jgi:hypothetical protein